MSIRPKRAAGWSDATIEKTTLFRFLDSCVDGVADRLALGFDKCVANLIAAVSMKIRVWRSFSAARCGSVGLASTGVALGLLLCVCALSSDALGRADGPDNWDVTRVEVGTRVKLHSAPSARSAVVKSLAHDSRGLKNLGCKAGGASTHSGSAAGRWCKVQFQGVQGWILGRYLAEGKSARPPLAPSSTPVGNWIVTCDVAECAVEQTAGSGREATKLRIEPRPSNNARIVISRGAIPETGVLSIAMDGKPTTSGPIAPLRAENGNLLVLTPDDVTLGMLRKMATSKSMVLAISGDAAEVAFDLRSVSRALTLARRMSEGNRR